MLSDTINDKKKKFFYLGQDEYGEMSGINLFINKAGSIFIIIDKGNDKKRIPLSKIINEKYELIKRVSHIIITKEEQRLDCIENKKTSSYYFRYYPVSLSYLNDQYILSIQLPDSTFKFVIHNIDELLSSLKEGMIFPGDKFIGLEAIELSNRIKEKSFWKAKCLLCGREVNVTDYNVKNNKSCGCLNGSIFDSDEERFFSYVDKQENVSKELQIRGTLGMDEEPCWLWMGSKSKRGYGNINMRNSSIQAHRYSYKLHYNKDLTPDIYVCHCCDNPSCVNPNHLFEGTQSDNMQDMIKKGRANRINYIKGEATHNSKLTAASVIMIRKRVEDGEKQRALSKEFDVSTSNICNIIKRKIWDHI